MSEVFPKLDHSLTSDNHLASVWLEGGLTKRELFAALALHSLLSDPHQPNWNKTNYARQAVDYADLLLEALAGDSP